MAMINCPNCGQEISDKSRKCIHCETVLVEEIQPQKFCTDCGKEIPFNSQECPFCGCPSENKPLVKSKKPIIITIVILTIAVIVGLIVTISTSILNEDEQLAYENAVKLKSMMKNPDSFKLYDEFFLLKSLDDDGNVEYTYTIFKYGGTNGYGAVTTDEAIFKDNIYIMDYADEPDEDDYNYITQLGVKADIAIWLLTGDGDTWQTVDIDVDKIKDKMGLE